MKIQQIKMYLAVIDYLECATKELVCVERVEGKRRKVCQCGARQDLWSAATTLMRHADGCLAADLMDKISDLQSLVENGGAA